MTRRLSKAEVEVLLGHLDGSPADVRAALAEALATVLGATGSWRELVRLAAGYAGWDDSRRDALLRDDPHALDQLAAELNELRTLEVPEANPGSAGGGRG